MTPRSKAELASSFHLILRRVRLCLLAVTLGLGSCSRPSQDVGVRINLLPDLSGTVHTRSLVAEDVRGTLISGSDGVEWEHHAQMVFGRGKFASIMELRFEEIRFEVSITENGVSILTVTMARGPDVKWLGMLTSKDPDLRSSSGATLNPESTTEAGGRIEFLIELPTEVISQGVSPRARGVRSSHKGNFATLSVTADAAQVAGEDLVWVIAW